MTKLKEISFTISGISNVLQKLIKSICVLFILLMQWVNGAQFLNTISILLLPATAANATTYIVPLTRMYESL